jgi:uncharacterized protein (TIGR01244 family)
MNARTTLLIIIATLVPGVSTPADQEQSASARVLLDRSSVPIEVKGVEGVERNLFLDGRVYIGGQPSEAALARLRELGVTAVVNLRTPSEMDDRTQVPYDEAEAVDRLGMEYVWVPLGGDDHPYTEAAVDRFAQVMREHEGAVLVHCTMGWRAAYLWAAYLIREHGYELNEALARGEAIAITPPPLEGLLGRPLELAYSQ